MRRDWQFQGKLSEIVQFAVHSDPAFVRLRKPKENRIEVPIMDNHFGLITIDWSQKDPVIKMEIWDIRDNQRVEYSIKLSEIRFR